MAQNRKKQGEPPKNGDFSRRIAERPAAMRTEVAEAMKLELTERQYRYLLDLVYIGNWVINSTRGNDRIREYDQLESLIFSHCLLSGKQKLVELLDGELIPSRAFADGGIHEAIEEYEDVAFYEILAEEMAMRDMNGQPMTNENYPELLARIERYLAEFDAHGTDHISVDLENE